MFAKGGTVRLGDALGARTRTIGETPLSPAVGLSNGPTARSSHEYVSESPSASAPIAVSVNSMDFGIV